MTEKQMTLREYIDHLKNLRKVITANNCSMKSYWIFLFIGELFVFQIPDFCFLWLAFALMAKSSLLSVCVRSDPCGWSKAKWRQQWYFHSFQSVKGYIYVIFSGLECSLLYSQCKKKKKCFCSYIPFILPEPTLVALVFEKKKVSAFWCNTSFLRKSLLYL